MVKINYLYFETS